MCVIAYGGACNNTFFDHHKNTPHLTLICFPDQDTDETTNEDTAKPLELSERCKRQTRRVLNSYYYLQTILFIENTVASEICIYHDLSATIKATNFC